MSPRLHFNCGQVEDGVSFAWLSQWVSLFYSSSRSEQRFNGIEIGYGTRPLHPTYFQLLLLSYIVFAISKRAVTAVLYSYALRDEALHLAKDPGSRISVRCKCTIASGVETDPKRSDVISLLDGLHPFLEATVYLCSCARYKL